MFDEGVYLILLDNHPLYTLQAALEEDTDSDHAVYANLRLPDGDPTHARQLWRISRETDNAYGIVNEYTGIKRLKLGGTAYVHSVRPAYCMSTSTPLGDARDLWTIWEVPDTLMTYHVVNVRYGIWLKAGDRNGDGSYPVGGGPDDHAGLQLMRVG